MEATKAGRQDGPPTSEMMLLIEFRRCNISVANQNRTSPVVVGLICHVKAGLFEAAALCLAFKYETTLRDDGWELGANCTDLEVEKL